MSNIHIVRQHNENASETSIWRELTASDHEILIFHNCVHARDLVTTQSFSYGFSGWSRCNPQQQDKLLWSHKKPEPKRIDQSRDINEKKHHISIYSFLGSGHAIFLASVTSLHACIVFLSEAWSKFFEPCLTSTLCASTANMLLKRQFGVSWRPLIMQFLFVLDCCTEPCYHSIFLIWIFLMVQLQSTAKGQLILIS